MIKVQFHSTDEFMLEVHAMAQHIEGGIVRVTQELRRSSSLPLSRVFVVATAVVHKPGDDGKPAGRWLLRLDNYVGDMMGIAGIPDPVSAKVADTASSLVSSLETQVRAFGLLPRPGVFQLEGNS